MSVNVYLSVRLIREVLNALAFSKALEAVLIQKDAFVYVSIELVAIVLGGFLEVFPRAFRADLETTAWIGGPAEVSSIPEVVWIGISQ